MREFDALSGYPEPKHPRIVSSKLRTIHHRIIACYRDKEFYDGDRNFGYGGFNYDGRWLPIAKNMCKEYALTDQSSVLQIGCDKGFLLNDFLQVYPGMRVAGTEISDYAIQNAMESVKPLIQKSPFTNLPFEDGKFDYVIAIGPVYTLNLADAIKCLKEIQRVGKGKSFITLGSYTNKEDFWLFKNWTVLGASLLHEDEWIEVLKHVGYTGDYKFTGKKSLNLIPDKEEQ
jgi:hypothetical protein